jgi:glycosyltransferase involved in cell wall biosynthesis
MIDIINTYAKEGYSCVLLTGRLVQRNTPLNQTVRIERIIRYNRATTFRRLFTWVFGFLQIWLKVVFKYKRDYLFIVSNPPFAPLLPLIVKNPFQLLIFDIYPDSLSEMGYLSADSLLIKWWIRSNKKIYCKAKSIVTITGSMKQVLQKYSGNNPVEVVSVWTDNTFLKPVDPDQNPFLIKHRLCGKFVVLYSGNIGLAGDVDALIDVAEKIENDDILFLIIGEGAKKKMIQEKIRKLALKNVMLLPWQPVTELPYSLSSASLAVISLGLKASKLAIPSKLYNFLSVGAPLLCMTSKGSEVENLVANYKCGRNFEPNDIKGMADFIVEVAVNKELNNLMRLNSSTAAQDFSSINVAKFLATTSLD